MNIDESLYNDYLSSIVRYLKCSRADKAMGRNVTSIDTDMARRAMGQLASDFIDDIWFRATQIVEGEEIEDGTDDATSVPEGYPTFAGRELRKGSGVR